MRVTVNSYMKVWEVKEAKNPNFVDVRFTTSEKTKEGKYEQDFGGFASLWKGADGNNAVGLAAGDTIKPGASGRITNKYDKEKKQTYQNIILFEYEIQANEQKDVAPAAASDDFMDLPFDESEFV